MDRGDSDDDEQHDEQEADNADADWDDWGDSDQGDAEPTASLFEPSLKLPSPMQCELCWIVQNTRLLHGYSMLLCC